MAAINKIVSKKVISTIVKDGQPIVVSAATETLHWKRAEDIAEKVGDVLAESLPSWGGKLPEGTKEVCSRESVHKSDADKRDHITAVCIDSNNKGTTIHIPVKRT